eukprot:219828_1
MRSKLLTCGIFIFVLALLIPFSLNNVTLFLVVTDSIWYILNYIDNSQLQYDGNIYIHSKPLKPVKHEFIDYNLEVIGSIPIECDGVMFKIGPNPARKNIAIKTHWFDSDGMIHSIRLISKNNTAHYSNSFIHTPRYITENKILNRSVYFNFLGPTMSNGVIGLIKMIFGRFITESKWSPININKYTKNDNPYQSGTQNTNILNWNNKLFALVENSLPFQFKYNISTSSIQSIGYYNFDNSWTIPFTAHPKIDKNTTQLFTHGVYIRPDMNTIVIGMTTSNNKNILINSAAFYLNSAQMMHDMMITEHYILIFDLNMWFGKDVFKATKAKKVMAFETETKSRIGLMNRKELENKKMNAKIRWFDIKPCFVFHFVNAYENNKNEIIIIGNRFDRFDASVFQFSKYNLTESIKSIYMPVMYEWKINMELNDVTERELNMNIDDKYHVLFPMINPLYLGKKNRYMWCMLDIFSNDNGPVMEGIIKYDLESEKVINTIKFKNNHVGNSEFSLIFPKLIDKDEDDMFISGFIYDYKKDVSRVEIYDAQSMDSKSVATIKLKRRVPMGFHSEFVSKDDLDIMDKSNQ